MINCQGSDLHHTQQLGDRLAASCHTLTLTHSLSHSFLSLPNPGQHRSKTETLITNHNHPSLFWILRDVPIIQSSPGNFDKQNRTSVKLGLAAPPNHFTTIPLNPRYWCRACLTRRLLTLGLQWQGSRPAAPGHRFCLHPTARLAFFFFWSGLFLSSEDHRRPLFSRKCDRAREQGTDLPPRRRPNWKDPDAQLDASPPSSISSRFVQPPARSALVDSRWCFLLALAA